MSFEDTIARYPVQRCAVAYGSVGYRESGRGLPLVLLHGIGSGAGSWVCQLQALSARFRVLAWDAPGYGESTPLASDSPAASDYAAVLAQWLDALRIDQCALVGHSLGAIVAAACAADHPRRVARLVLLSPARGYGGASAEERERRLAERLAMLDTLGIDGIAAQRSRAMASPAASPEIVAWVAWNTRRISPSGYRQAARMLAFDDITRYASRFSPPVQVASGALDRITPPEGCQAIAQAFARGRYEAIAGAGHAVYLEAHEAVDRLLLREGTADAVSRRPAARTN